MSEKVKVGFIGAGCISEIYLRNIASTFHGVEVFAICDLFRERADAAAEKYSIPRVYDTSDQLLADDEVEIVLNITRPYEHYAVTKAALNAGKHVYSEKPLSPDINECWELVKLAQDKGLYLGGAPDTFMGAGIQTCRKLIDEGWIGRPIGATARMASHGPEDWHPDPEFVYQYGGGPMLDMGPYYVTALVNLLGPVKEVSGMTAISFPERPILSEKKFGQIMKVEVPTYVNGCMRFENGAIANIFTTFDIYTPNYYPIEIFGSEGTILVPDPNMFKGPVKLKRGNGELMEIPLAFDYNENSRGLGLADMASAIKSGRKHRANSAQQLHVVEIMTSILKAQELGREVEIESQYERSVPMASGLLHGILD